MQKDFSFIGSGSVVLVVPLTRKADRFTKARIYTEPWQWMGSGFACEPRMAQEILEGVRDAGLTVEVL